MSERRGLYEIVEPYESGMFDVGDGHSLYYERVGTPGAKPAVFLHGGPGGGISDSHRGQWDPELYDVLLFEQRGCGRSTPFASLENNTTQDLIADIEKLRAHCGHDKWQVFGGSWGSTLSLAYAQAHPERVDELILRGIFFGDEREYGWLFKYGASELYPDEFEKFLAVLPEDGRDDPIQAFHHILTGDDEDKKLEAARAWSRWEAVTVTVLPDPDVMAHMQDAKQALAMARIENHYMRHGCFLEEGEILAKMDRIAHIPGIIVQGRHDCCTPPHSAWLLAKAWPEGELQIVDDGGHSYSEPGILDGLVRATDRFAGKSA
ncbi:prolyl aminopeptidase [Sphingomicrobium sediminis]|uniref:Proline iminopeptidase n=1 Tax=Sphingomicrobium sediminis TaxID=2950949 RepID=A0A9X2J4X3_9SPHN|nr:prolyl aminopeptidase [Sphingomicrobium sediminis]MCM8557652.1 prolyl aminopeptidase [Sphingomicrobium sediminis]